MIALLIGWASAAGTDWRAEVAASVAACRTAPAPCEAAADLVLRATRAGFLIAQDERLADPAIVGPLLDRLLHERDPKVRVGLADGVAEAIGGQPGSAWEAAWIDLAAADPQEEVRSVLVNALRRAPWSLAEPGLRGALASASARTRADAVATMGGHPERARFVPDLVGALADADPTVRGLAARALRWIADPATLPALEARRADPDPSARAQIERAIDAIR